MRLAQNPREGGSGVTILRRKSDKGKYDVLDADCIGRECLQLGAYHHRAATSSGSRATGSVSMCCLRRAYHGCPSPIPEPTKENERNRRDEGWRKA